MKKLMILAFFAVCTLSAAQEYQPLVTVMGEGKVIAVPDEVTIRVRVESEGKEVATVKKQNDQTVDNVLDYLLKMNIPQNQVKTEYVTLSKDYDYNQKTYTYRARQSISVLLKDLSAYEEIMSGLIDKGINGIDGIEFSSSKLEAYYADARKKAVANAKIKAAEYAGVLGQTIGMAVAISETGVNNPGPQPRYKMAVMSEQSMDSSSEQTLAPGEIAVIARVQVSFILN